jgi:hypothetical protein
MNPPSRLKNKDFWAGIRLLCMFLTIITCMIYPLQQAEASDWLSISGYFKNYSMAIDQPDALNFDSTETQAVQGSVSNRLRLNVSGKIKLWLTISLAYDLSPRIQDSSLFGEQMLGFDLGKQTYRAVDFDSRLYPQEGEPVSSFAVFHNLDRALLSIKSKLFDLYLGRQAISWGSARVVNPTDILIPFTFNELDVEDRIGVDAVRLRVPIGFMAELDGGYVFGEDFEYQNSAFFLRSKFYYRRTDISLLALGFRENLLAGFDLARSIGGAGFWFEGAYVFAGALDPDERDSDEDYFRATTGLDYILRDGTYLFAEYHYNQAGLSNAYRYLYVFDKTAYTEGAVYLFGRQYLAPGISRQITPLITLTSEALINLGDQSVFFMPQVEYNVAEDVYLSGGAYLGLGKEPKQFTFYGYGPFLRLRSEFGTYPDFYFTSFRVYF